MVYRIVRNDKSAVRFCLGPQLFIPRYLRYHDDMRRHLRSQAGFTLLELIVVMAIMGLLIAVTASTFQTSRIKGKDGRRKSDLKQIQNALEAYMNDHSVYPQASAPTGGSIVACGGSGTTACAFGSAFTDENGTVYMAQIPSDPSSPTLQYLYLASSDQKQYQIFTYLENTQDSSTATYVGKNCPTVTYQCNYGVSSANTTPGATLP